VGAAVFAIVFIPTSLAISWILQKWLGVEQMNNGQKNLESRSR
jgi:hypothetical protein